MFWRIFVDVYRSAMMSRLVSSHVADPLPAFFSNLTVSSWLGSGARFWKSKA